MREIWPEVEIALSRLDTGDLFAADVAADLAMDLFTGDPKGVVRYRGRGPLGAWLRVAAVRRLANARRSKRRKREQELTDDELLVRVTASTPELEVAKAVARQAVSTALSEALQLLSPAERNLLRSHHLDGQTFAQLAAIYHLDDSRVWRMLCRARAKLAAATREKLYTRLGMERSEVDSLLRMALSQLDTNLRRALGTEEIQAEPDA